MGVIGCHNCKKWNPEEYKDKPYEEWPCASCPLAKEYTRTFSTGYFDTADLDEIAAEDKPLYDDPNEHLFVTSGDFPLQEEEIRSLEAIKSAIMRQMYVVFSGLLVKLLYMAKKSPEMFEVFIKKMQFPYMSYSDIGSTMDPPCGKQTVLYRLRKVVEKFPELASVINTDTRYSGGRYTIKTLATRKRQELAARHVDKAVFGDKYVGYAYSVADLNKLLKLPFNVRDEVFTFNAYLDSEKNNETANRQGSVQDS